MIFNWASTRSDDLDKFLTEVVTHLNMRLSKFISKVVRIFDTKRVYFKTFGHETYAPFHWGDIDAYSDELLRWSEGKYRVFTFIGNWCHRILPVRTTYDLTCEDYKLLSDNTKIHINGVELVQWLAEAVTGRVEMTFYETRHSQFINTWYHTIGAGWGSTSGTIRTTKYAPERKLHVQVKFTSDKDAAMFKLAFHDAIN